MVHYANSLGSGVMFLSVKLRLSVSQKETHIYGDRLRPTHMPYANYRFRNDQHDVSLIK